LIEMCCIPYRRKEDLPRSFDGMLEHGKFTGFSIDVRTGYSWDKDRWEK